MVYISHKPPFGREFEHNSHVKVRNTLVFERLTKSKTSHLPPFGNEAH